MVRKLPRAKGYDKAATLRHLKQMVKSGTFVTEYVKQNGLRLDTFMLAVATHDPSSLGQLPCHAIQNDPKLITQNCEECGDVFWPSRKGSRFCSSSCGNTARRDRDYFDGRRKDTIGLAEGVCQLCSRHVDKGLSSHHVFGKANDPENEYLLALCRGCHQIVSELALKKWCGDPEVMARMIELAYAQHEGDVLIGLHRNGEGIVWEVSYRLTP